jgi:AraC family transcriptional regulator of adaptative response/methylated-DNA-[protein]-cysteine methyltransferase
MHTATTQAIDTLEMNHTNVDAYLTDPERWQALVHRDPGADGAFVYGVTTTGVYCRPTCASKRPNRGNVRFFDRWEEAEGAGFRPCRRCAPSSLRAKDPHREAILRACQLMDAAEMPPSLDDLARTVGYSPSYFHRLFKRIVGVTPKQYAMEKRLNRVRDNLQAGTTVTEAVYEAGFGSGSRFYEDAAASLGMKPSTYRKGGRGMRIRFAVTQCFLGWVLIAATEKGVCAIEFADAPGILEERLRARFSKAEFLESDPAFREWSARVLAYLESPHDGLDLPLDVRGTAFQRRVWMALCEIPPGSTASYGEIAARLGNPKAARAVAGACGANAVAVAIPCHRAVRSDGSLGGYRWGYERKRKLLEREASKTTRGECVDEVRVLRSTHLASGNSLALDLPESALVQANESYRDPNSSAPRARSSVQPSGSEQVTVTVRPAGTSK